MDDSGRADRDASFEARLAAARARQGLGEPAPGQERQAISPWGLGMRAGLEVAAALAVGLGLGLAADRGLGTLPLFLVMGVVLGGAAGVLNVYRLMMGRRGAGSEGTAHAGRSGDGADGNRGM